MSKNPQKQANINAKKFGQLMKDIEKDVGRRTINAKNTDDWMNKLGMYVNRNPFTTGGIKHDETVEILNNIMGQAKFKGLARGGTQELVKGVISENTMHYVTRMGDDMKNNLRRIFVDSYNQKMAPREIARRLKKEVQGLSKTRAMTIARTETMRASNLSNYVNAKLNMGARSYHVLSDPHCCDKCVKTYEHGDVWFDIDDLEYLPPGLHPNCRCTAAYSTKTADENNGGKPQGGTNEKGANQNKKLERMYPQEGETYGINRERIVGKLSKVDLQKDLKEMKKISGEDLTKKQIKQNLKYYEEMGVEKNVAKKMESKIQKIANISHEQSYSFDLKGNKLQHFKGGSSSVQAAEGPYTWHNHPFERNSFGATPSNGTPRANGDMATYIRDLNHEALSESGLKLVDGVAHGNQRIFIVGDSNKYMQYIESIATPKNSGLDNLTKKYKKIVDNMQKDYNEVNSIRIAKGLQEITAQQFAYQYENIMFKEFNNFAKNYGIEIVKWIL